MSDQEPEIRQNRMQVRLGWLWPAHTSNQDLPRNVKAQCKEDPVDEAGTQQDGQ